jgi:hypothetical protein
MNLGFDSKCADLADHFLQDEPAEIVRKRNDLAQAIQDAVEDWFEVEHSSGAEMITVEQLRELTALQAEDAGLWDTDFVSIHEAYKQQGLRYLTRAIEGGWTFEQARDAIKEMQP